MAKNALVDAGFEVQRGVTEGVNWYLQAKNGKQNVQEKPEVVNHLLN